MLVHSFGLPLLSPLLLILFPTAVGTDEIIFRFQFVNWFLANRTLHRAHVGSRGGCCTHISGCQIKRRPNLDDPGTETLGTQSGREATDVGNPHALCTIIRTENRERLAYIATTLAFPG